MAYHNYYPSAESRMALVKSTESNAGLVAMYGTIEMPGSLGQILAWESGLWMTLLPAIMLSLFASKLVRSPEHQGVDEILRSAGVSKRVVAWSQINTLGFVALIIGLGLSAILLAFGVMYDGLPINGCTLYGVMVALSAFGSALCGLFVILWARESTALTRISLITVAFAFILRSIADSKSWIILSWFTPLGWRQVISPFTDDSWVCAVIILFLNIIFSTLIVHLNISREWDQGIRGPATKKTYTSRAMGGPYRLRFVLDRPIILTWVLVTGGCSAFFMLLIGSMRELLSSDENTAEVFRQFLSQGELEITYVRFAIRFLSILIAVAGVSIVMRYRAAEKNRTVDIVRSTGINRSTPAVTVAASVILTVVTASVCSFLLGGMGLRLQAENVSDSVEALAWGTATAVAPAVLCSAFALFIVGWFPRASAIGWLLIVAAALLSIVGPMLKLSSAVTNLSVFNHTYSQLDNPSELWAQAIMLLGAVVLGAGGVVGIKGRDVG
ncbi:hypothetical protein GSS87_06215 [Corynebacterium sp. 4HC-13]|uniref:hypothetical protein n=1 Tax=Corynebacterium anserum TaxID=2684406 RepID=UPI00163A746D|nr:hypothetical protein [Corynebacterium anserum]MBC2681991.1 hypothetical protein [Corynebacterium anserum]